MDGELKWSEMVPCARSTHEIILAFSLWRGASVVINPCDEIPVGLRGHVGGICSSSELIGELNRLVEETWLGGHRSTCLSGCCIANVDGLYRSKHGIAQSLLAASGLAPAQALSTQRPELLWAALELLGDHDWQQSELLGLLSWLDCDAPMLVLAVLQILIDQDIDSFWRQVTATLERKIFYSSALHISIERLLESDHTPSLLWLIGSYASFEMADNVAKEYVCRCLQKLSSKHELRSAIEIMFRNAEMTSDRRVWRYLMRFLDHVGPQDLLSWAVTQGQWLLVEVALFVCSEQYLQRYAEDLVVALDHYPLAVNAIGPGFEVLIEHAGRGDALINRLRLSLGRSSHACLRKMACQA